MKHLDIGTIHAFLDGELAGDALEYAASHFSICDACSNLMLEAESESDAVMQAFAVENAYAVPTQRIWARINNEIDQLEAVPAPTLQSASIWQNLVGLLGLNNLAPFAAPSAALALGVALVAVFTFYNFRPDNLEVNPPQIATVSDSQTPVTMINVTAPENGSIVENVKDVPTATVATISHERRGRVEAVKASYRVEEKPTSIIRKPIVKPVVKANLKTPLVEERLYLDAINDLSQTVASTNDDEVMRPSFQVEYQQNLALIDKAIDKMQKQVRSNPKDENAKRILYASYQNKIDLLNTVAEKSQLMATLR